MNTRIPNLLATAAIAGIAVSANAQPYRCTSGGKTTYQEIPCEGGATVNTTGAGKGDPNSPSALQAQREISYIRRKEAVEEAIREKRVFIGMTAAEVLKSWGAPTKINRTVNASGVSEQWVYRRQGIGNDQYVYVENGVVRSMQSSL